MADHTSAALFGRIFEMLASDDPLPDRKVLARQFWDMYDEGDYDFNPDQMDCDEALEALDLARETEEEDEWGETYHYGPPI